MSYRLTSNRRTIILGTAGVLAGVAACGGDDDSATTEPGDQSGDTGASASSTESADSPAPDSGGEVIGAVADVPVGGGMVFADSETVVVQPEEGDFRAFSAVCTHQGCPIESIEDDEILCSLTCGHGSRFGLADGSVVAGPAPQPLPAVAISVDGDNIVAS